MHVGWKGKVLESFIWAAARTIARGEKSPPSEPREILILRNNDIGDLLCTSPLFEAIKTRFPNSKLLVAIGPWNRPVLEHNPHVDKVIDLPAPWGNKYVTDRSARHALKYIALDTKVRSLARRPIDLGIDVFGSHLGALLLMRMRVPWRVGVQGYRGGHTGFHQSIAYDERINVSEMSLQFATALGAQHLPPNRPQLFRTDPERDQAEHHWRSHEGDSRRRRILIGPAGGVAGKGWPIDDYAHLVPMLEQDQRVRIIVVGGPGDVALGQRLAAAGRRTRSVCGQVSLRETFALAASADLVLASPSMLLHAAAAFETPTLVLMGDHYPDAPAHDRQWGYPTAKSLGRAPTGRLTLYNPRR